MNTRKRDQIQKFHYSKIIIILFMCSCFHAGCGISWQVQKNLSRSNREKTTEWKTYKNSEYFYEIKIPQGWEMVEAMSTEGSPPAAIRQHEILVNHELHKVTFLEEKFENWQGQFQIRMLANLKKITLDEWVKNYKRESATGANLIEEISDTTVSDLPAKRLSIFAFDHEDIEIVTTAGENIYILNFSGDNPNDSEVERHKEIYERILSTFRFTR